MYLSRYDVSREDLDTWWPTCAVCRRQVESLTRTHDPMRLVTVFEARCHGQVERTEIADVTMVNLRKGAITAGFAFSKEATSVASSASAKARTCPECQRANAMNRVGNTDLTARRCRYCGHEDNLGKWTKRTAVNVVRSPHAGHRVSRAHRRLVT